MINNRNSKVDILLRHTEKWQKEIKKLRTIILECGLTEEMKWGKPCYTFQGKNIVLIQGFKKYCALLFFKGALLKDAHSLLVKTGENTRIGRQIRFTDISGINELESLLKVYIQEAIEVEKAGLKVNLSKNA